MPLFIIFLLWPFLEIAVFIAAGGAIGFLQTIGLMILSMLAGGALMQYQGLKSFASLRDTLNVGELPVQDIFDGLCLYVAGMLLILPGFLSDFFAVLLLIPPLRHMLRRYLGRFFKGEPVIFRSGRAGQNTADSIDAEFTRIEIHEETSADDLKRLS